MALAFTGLGTVPGTIRWHSWVAAAAVYEVLLPYKYIKQVLGLAGDRPPSLMTGTLKLVSLHRGFSLPDFSSRGLDL